MVCIAGKRVQETICLTLCIALMVFNLSQLVLHFKSENWYIILICSCKYIYSFCMFLVWNNLNYSGIIHIGVFTVLTTKGKIVYRILLAIGRGMVTNGVSGNP